MANRGPVQRRGWERRESLLVAASELIDEYGPFSPELSVRAIADRAQTSVGTLYHYFPDLDALIEAVAQQFMEQVVAETASARTAGSGVPWTDQINSADLAFQSIFRRRPGLRELWFNPRAPFAVAKIHQRYHRQIAARSQEWFYGATGVRLDLTVHLVLVTMVGALLELAFRDNPKGDRRVFEEIRRVQLAYYGMHLELAQAALDNGPAPG
jgi:AcrR family transcriptional regulator